MQTETFVAAYGEGRPVEAGKVLEEIGVSGDQYFSRANGELDPQARDIRRGHGCENDSLQRSLRNVSKRGRRTEFAKMAR